MCSRTLQLGFLDHIHWPEMAVIMVMLLLLFGREGLETIGKSFMNGLRGGPR